MESSKVGYWLQVASNVGVLAGLLLVGLQLRQTSDLTRIQLLYEESARASQSGLILLGEDSADAWVKAVTKPEALTLKEQRIVETMIWLDVENWRAAYRLSQLGLIDDDWKLRVDQEALFVLNYPYGRAVWKHLAESVQPELAQYIDDLFASSSFNPYDYYNDIQTDALQIIKTAPENPQ